VRSEKIRTRKDVNEKGINQIAAREIRFWNNTAFNKPENTGLKTDQGSSNRTIKHIKRIQDQ